MTRIVAVHGVLPPYRYDQQEITEALGAMCRLPRDDRRLLERVHAGSGVTGRHLALSLERYAELDGFGARNDAFLQAALELGREAVLGALDRSGLSGADIDLIVSTSVTGIAAPSVEARLASELGLRPDVKRVPVFGLGCAAGAAGIARLHDYLVGHRDHTALLLSVELCSLTLQHRDASMRNLVAGALFGDGAAALLAVGRDRLPGPDLVAPEIVATRSHLFPDTEHLLGWDVCDTGFRIVMGADLPEVVRRQLGPVVRDFLAGQHLKTPEIDTWVCHPGGPKILDAVREALDIPARSLEPTRRSLAEVGNLSSASVLHILRDTLAGPPPPPGSPGLLLAMGPGFCTELVLLRW
jgi:alkylresorcinol/alkylpyrone synthase